MKADATQAPDCRIGDWVFSPAANELSRGEERRKLEHRAARTLELLCSRRGEVVSQEEIVGQVWSGRAISPNSVPVVISDLRQALGDDARDPRHIETLPKRGYRLLDDGEGQCSAAEGLPPAAASLRRVVIGILLLFVLAALFAWWTMRADTPTRYPLIVTKVENATGSPDYQPLADATSEVILANAQKMPGIEAFRAGAPRDGAFTLGARLIIWSGRPTVMMSAADPSGAVVWTGMTSGREDLIPPEVASAVQDLSGKLVDRGR